MTDLEREPDAGNPHVRFDEREVETERPAMPPRHLSTLPADGVDYDVTMPKWRRAHVPGGSHLFSVVKNTGGTSNAITGFEITNYAEERFATNRESKCHINSIVSVQYSFLFHQDTLQPRIRSARAIAP